MNSKAEFNRCEIARLSLGESKVGVDVVEDSSSMEREIREWVTKRTNTKEDRVELEKLMTAPVPIKRGKSDILSLFSNWNSTLRSRTWLVGERISLADVALATR